LGVQHNETTGKGVYGYEFRIENPHAYDFRAK
jgi:hypothetical protein